MARSTEEIVNLANERKRAADPRLAKMRELLAAYEGDIVIPLPEMDQAEKPMVANLIASGLDQTAQRISSALPDVRCPPTRSGDYDVHLRRAAQRRSAIRGWWGMNRLNLALRKRARFLVGYTSSPVVIRPDPIRSIPAWQIRDPLTALPPPTNGLPGTDMTPADCIFSFSRTWSWLERLYPAHLQQLRRPRDRSPDVAFNVVEYVDADELVLIACSRDQDSGDYAYNTTGAARFVELDRIPNKAGICPAVVPGRISLGEPQGQFDGLLGLYWWQSKMMALGGLAAERDVFPEEWAIARPGEAVQIITPADGPAGQIGELQGGDIKVTHQPPGQATLMMIDRVERAMRLTGGIPAEFGGESPTNIRTARRGAAVLSSAVDFPVQEAQELLAASLEEENIRAIATAKAWFPGPRSFHYSWNNRPDHADYDTAEAFDTDANLVTYSFPGSDINQLVIGTGQRIGMGTMSKRRGMELDPMIEDPEREHAAIIAEGLEVAFLSSIQQQAAQGALAPADLARITKLVVANGRPLYEAVTQAQAEAQRRQASAGPEGTPEGPVPAGAPEAQPGLGMGPPGAAAPIAAPAEGQMNFSQLMSVLRRPTQQVPAEMGG